MHSPAYSQRQVHSGGNVGGVPSSVAESALQTYVAMKVSEKGWHRVGRYFAHGDLLGKNVVDVALVRMVRTHIQCDH